MPSAAYSFARVRAKPTTAAANRIGKSIGRPRLLDRGRGDGIRRPHCFSACAVEFPWRKRLVLNQKLVEGGAPVFRLCALKRFRRGAAAIGKRRCLCDEAGLDGADKGSNCFRISHIQRLKGTLVARRFSECVQQCRPGCSQCVADGPGCAPSRDSLPPPRGKSFAGRRDDGYAAVSPRSIHPIQNFNRLAKSGMRQSCGCRGARLLKWEGANIFPGGYPCV